ncbi:hypothetical protein [Flaviaesturariibacter amylovorans]|uniref:DUF4625 domain-containing protein n=1 Tax=Flaviaesturariibacter amylovorans TaxID=1084520 RepID=A0ABP8GKW3_9BACT
MLIADKALSGNIFIITVSERLDPVPSNLHMMVHSTFSNVTYDVELPESTSPYPDRYDKYTVAGSAFEPMEPGLYSFTIEADGTPVKSGMLKVIDQATDQAYLIQEVDDTEDDFLIHE